MRDSIIRYFPLTGWQAPRSRDYLMRAMDREQEHDEIRSRAVHKSERAPS
jgi:hypothetical protein